MTSGDLQSQATFKSMATFKTMPSLGKTDREEKHSLEVSSRLEGYLKTKVAKELFSR